MDVSLMVGPQATIHHDDNGDGVFRHLAGPFPLVSLLSPTHMRDEPGVKRYTTLWCSTTFNFGNMSAMYQHADR